MAMIAIEKSENQQRKSDKLETKGFAKKNASKLLSDSLQELFRDIGISKFEDNLSFPANYPNLANESISASGGNTNHSFDGPSNQHRNLFSGTVVAPATDRPEDMYHGSLNHARQSMLLRMEHLFDEVESKIVVSLDAGSSVLQLLSTPGEEVVDGKTRLPTKPVVIGDALPIPVDCPDTVDQLLEAALAHHNLGSFEESLKFLEAARIQLSEIIQGYKTSNDIDNSDLQKVNSYFDVQMYITICKGNVYQSCGDDEQSLINYMEGWSKSKGTGDTDWEIVCINSIGMLAFFSLRYEVALLCFSKVYGYRELVSFYIYYFYYFIIIIFCFHYRCPSIQAYGADSPDTATALNNEACSLYCLNKRGESRLRFEKSWNALTKALGHRSPRAVTVWKNLEKARRSHLPLQNKRDMKESIEMRPDSDRLIMGGSFTIQALPPPEPTKKKKGGGGKKKKK
jgi:tetratricopeptide (TPR) repeat protein